MDADARLVRRTAWTVGAWMTVAATVLVIAVLVAASSIVLGQIPLAELLDRRHHEESIDVGGLDALAGIVVIGLLAIVLACTLSLIVTRRAVAPLVDALARQRRFVADASHELRTPLAVLDARLQVLERSLPPDDPQRGIVAELRADSRSLIAVVSDLLDSVDVASSGHQQPAALAPIVQTAVSSMRMLGQDRGVHVTAGDVAPDVWVRVPETSLHRALVAVIDNAVKNSAAGDAVEVAVRADRAQVRIAVRDHGPGIRGIPVERVFDRFARAAEPGAGGFGIGLSLVQDTAGRFGGWVEVTETSADGTTITIGLPRAKRR
nr:HAMP domain-containing sensor histidine kinase [Microbacterium bovistercoris]